MPRPAKIDPTRARKTVFYGIVLFSLGVVIRIGLPPIGFLGLFIAAAGGVLIAYAALANLALSRCGEKMRRAALVLMRLIRIGAAVFAVTFVLFQIYLISGSRGSADSGGADYVIVLGAQVNGETPSLMLAARLRTAQNYLEANPDSCAILSGAQGPGESITEARAMRLWLEKRGIDPSRLIEEDRSRSTIENIRNSFEIIKAEGGADKICVLSNDFHLRRAQVIGALEGHKLYAVNAPTPRPDLAVCYYLREYFSFIKVLLVYAF